MIAVIEDFRNLSLMPPEDEANRAIREDRSEACLRVRTRSRGDVLPRGAKDALRRRSR